MNAETVREALKKAEKARAKAEKIQAELVTAQADQIIADNALFEATRAYRGYEAPVTETVTADAV